MSEGEIDAARSETPDIPPEPDPVAPLFFVSHATAYGNSRDVQPSEPNAPFSIFFDHLSQDVGQLAARQAGKDPGFLDRGMHAGVPWETEILEAVGRCQVLVALVSDPFAKSEWCGMEWDAFARRRTWRREGGVLVPSPKCILPVVWANPNPAVPSVVAKQQQFVPSGLGPVYLRDGVYGMYTTGQRDAYRTTVWRLAQEIKKLIIEYWVEPDVPKGSKFLTNRFDEEQS